MSSASERSPLAALRARVPEMISALAALVEVESPSSDIAATERCAMVVDELGAELIGKRAERIEVQGRTHLLWRFGTETDVLALGHVDTVWPLGTVARWPFSVDGDTATGPGCFDMKAGIVQLFYALSILEDLERVAVLLTTDEEIGSPSSRSLIEQTAKGVSAALVFEPSAGGALKTQRKGVSSYQIAVTGRAAHAGLDPDKGINAGVEIAHQVISIAALSDPALGTTVTPTLLAAGSSGNTVPASALLHVDVRAPSPDEQQRVDSGLRGLRGVVPGTSLQVELTATTPPMPRSAAAKLFNRARRIALELGLASLEERSVGGGSDGNLTAGMGIPTLDGLGAVGDLAHAEGEYVIIPAIPERAALTAALVGELIRQ